jgi:D-alanyl-lipoteichoic acid acyltransferase DltB (MBOAT superfamily)
MLFTSLEFFAFLALALFVFALLPARWRSAWLLFASWIFYGAAHPAWLVFLGTVTLAVCGLGWAIERAAGGRRIALLTAGILVLAGSLIGFKFYDFTAAEIERLAGAGSLALPRLGISGPAGFSFYVFSALSYLVDVHLRRVPDGQRAVDVALYLGYFPKILAGPIERAPAFLGQLGSRLRRDPASVVLALQLIGWGMFKKVVIADNLAPVVDHAFGIAAYAPPIELLTGIYFFAFQIYCDFSGYTDMAIGISLLFGIRLMENFRRPYLSASTAEFWGERWHVSLGRWFRDYLYIPLGGSRSGALRTYRNVMIVFLVSGLWHAGLGYGVGWTFLAWGALNGIYQCLGAASRPVWLGLAARLPRTSRSAAWRAARVLLTFQLIAITWIFFRARSLGDAWAILGKLGSHLGELPAMAMQYPFTGDQCFGAGLIALLIVVEIMDERRSNFDRLAAAPVALRWGVWYAGLLALLLLGRWQAHEFIYMQF